MEDKNLIVSMISTLTNTLGVMNGIGDDNAVKVVKSKILELVSKL